jgi:hypothetical protein
MPQRDTAAVKFDIGHVLVIEAPVGCAVEIAKAAKPDLHLRLRLGVHSGRGKVVADVDEQMNVAGAGVNSPDA